jgi:hypothetical protein
MKFGQKGDPHDIVHPKYPFWGCVGKTTVEPTVISQSTLAEAQQLLDSLNISRAGFHLTHTMEIPYYSGKLPEAKALLLRFEREDGRNAGLGGEHISVVYDIENKRLLGLTRMQAELDNSAFVSHQKALDVALTFLKQVASEMISSEIKTPELIDLSPGERMDFVPALRIGNVELHWVGDHAETIQVDGATKEIHGIKVKMQLPGDELYAWTIVDKHGQVETFEYSINWDFEAMMRKTQMWLHDNWLKAQAITLQPVAESQIQKRPTA